MAKRTIPIVISGEYTGHHAFAQAKSDLQAMLATAREAGQRLSPFGRLVGHAEGQDSARAAAAASAAMAQTQMRQELDAANAEARSRYLQEEQAAILAGARAEQAEMARTATVRRDLTDRIYATTHTARQVDLRGLRNYYAQMRLEARGNASQLALIDRAYASERAALLTGKGILGTRAGRSAVSMLAVEGLGMISPELGGAAGVGMRAAMLGASASVAAGVGAIALAAYSLGSAYRSAKADAKAVLATQLELNAAIIAGVKALRDVAATTGAGQRGRTALSGWQSAQEKAFADMLAAREEAKGWFHPLEGLKGLVGAKNVLDRFSASLKNVLELNKLIGPQLAENAKHEAEQARRVAEDNQLTLARLRIEGMANGPIKERRRLLEQEHQEFLAAQRYMADNPAASDRMGPLKEQWALKWQNFNAEQAAAEMKANAEIRRHLRDVETRGIADDVQRQVQEIRNGYVDRLELARAHGLDVVSLEEAQAKEIAQVRAAAAKAEGEERKQRTRELASQIERILIETTKEGLDRELALLQQKMREEIDVARTEVERELVRRKYDLLGRQAAKADAEAARSDAGPMMVAPVDAGLMTRARYSTNPLRELEKQQTRTAEAAVKTAAAVKETIPILQQIMQQLGIPPRVAHFGG